MNDIVVIERAGDNLSAYSPQVPGCVATGATRAEVLANMQEALAFHPRGLREEGLPVPEGVDRGAEEVVVLGVGAVSPASGRG